MTDPETVGVPTHLFTWVDVENHFRLLARRREWPDWLREISAYWDGVEFIVDPRVGHGQIWEWLADSLGGTNIDRENSSILLEPSEPFRTLPVIIVPSSEGAELRRRRPEWEERNVTRGIGDPLPGPEETFVNGVGVGAFHSFKGGVGRTLHAVALAQVIASDPSHRVLLVDADMEAPGISWMMKAQSSRIDFSFSDFLSILHGSEGGGGEEAVEIARTYLLNQELNGVFVLPVQRDHLSLGPPRIEPSDLMSPGRSPYYLTEALAQLADSVGAGTVLIDLRAGMSEISAPVLLDPRVKRVFVTTLSDQAVQGTVGLLKELGRRAPSVRDSDPLPAALVTSFDENDHAGLVASTAELLGDALSEFVKTSTDETTRRLVSSPIQSPFRSSLLALPAAWNEVTELLRTSDIGDVLRPLANELVPVSGQTFESAPGDQGERLQEQRQKLASFAADLRFAESGAGGGAFLRTDALTALARAHRTDLPVEVIVGAKGAGKTFTYLTLCRRQDWKTFASDVGVSGTESSAPIVPVLTSQSLDEEVRSQVEEFRLRAVERIGGAPTPISLRDLVTDPLKEEHPDSHWRRVWLTCLAWSAGITTSTPETAEADLMSLAERGGKAVFVLDGLEDLFQNFHHDSGEQQALRVLLTACPDWLRALRGRPFGIVIFIRRDLVQRAIRQNTAQYMAKYRNYALQWNTTEVLRLVTWTVHHAGALPVESEHEISSMSESGLADHLLGLWGEQLGTRRSKEARSKEWFLAALSDYNNQIQARDIVWFLAEAGRRSTSDGDRWLDRLLPPSAMRDALLSCSEEKVQSIAQEIPELKRVFAHLRSLDKDKKRMPFDPDVLDLGNDDRELLSDNGVIAEVKGEYWMPEIFRQALDFTPWRRPPVLSIRKALQRRMVDL